jgi:hypothetical protein
MFPVFSRASPFPVFRGEGLLLSEARVAASPENPWRGRSFSVEYLQAKSNTDFPRKITRK